MWQAVNFLVILSLIVFSGCIKNGEVTESTSNDHHEGIPADYTVVEDQDGATNSDDDQVVHALTPTPSQAPLDDRAGSIMINDGASLTRSANLELKFDFVDWNQMKVSWNATCDGGMWEPFVSSKSMVSPLLNQSVAVSVQYLDYDNGVSPCATASIVHDDLPPTIIFSKYPTSPVEEGTPVELIYEVSDAGAGVASVTCNLNGLEKTCNPGRNTVLIPALGVGDYTFTIAAQDRLESSAEQTIHWTVTSSYRHLTQTVIVNDYKKVDILFVIDNSGSMAYEQTNMAQRVRNFLSILQGLDWRIAVTTTDPTKYSSKQAGKYFGDGDLIPIYGTSSYYLNSSTAADEAQYRLGMTLQRPETGSGSEQGIYATYRVIERSVAQAQSPQQLFFRSGAQFAVVLISDEDESANTEKNDPQALVNLMHTSFGSQKTFTFHSIITRPGDVTCRNTYGATYGERYKTLTTLTGGVLGSVCEQDYAQQLTGIAQGVRDMLKTVSLQCAPITDRGFSVEVSKNGQAFTLPFHVDGLNLVFNDILDPGDLTIRYTCLAQ